MRLLDTHAHLDDRKFDADRDAVLQRAAAAGVLTLITVGADLPSSRAAVALAEHYPNVYATVGIHPHEASTLTPAVFSELRNLIAHPCVVAIGEIGLDFYHDFSPRDAQRFSFESQLALAAETARPIVVHVRDRKGQYTAYDETFSILCSQPPHPFSGVFHCFSGNLEIARTVLDLGFYIGVDGPVTYPNATHLRSMIAQIPLDRLLLETDCPYLTPQARRGRRNEPAYLTWIAEQVAELKGIDVNQVASMTTANARHLFQLA